MYQEKKLSTGRVVHIRPLTWDEFWRLGEHRLALEQKMSAPAKAAEPVNQLDAMRAARTLRELPLTWCVENFAELVADCSVAEFKELELTLNAMSETPVREGNSVPAAVPTATAAA